MSVLSILDFKHCATVLLTVEFSFLFDFNSEDSHLEIEGAQEDILNCGGIDTVLNLLCKGEISKENLLSLASEILLNCTGNGFYSKLPPYWRINILIVFDNSKNQSKINGRIATIRRCHS